MVSTETFNLGIHSEAGKLHKAMSVLCDKDARTRR
jgi:hypothetical protein